MERKPVITEVYFITHPAWTVSAGLYDIRHTPNQIANRINGTIKPAVDLASGRKNAFVVLVRQGPPPAMNKAKAQYAKYYGLSWRRARKRSAIENGLAKYVAGKMGDRHVVVNTRDEYEINLDGEDLKRVACEVARQIKEKGYEISENATVLGLGTYKEKCAGDFPREFMYRYGGNLSSFGKLCLPGWGTVSAKEKLTENERRRQRRKED